jgi:hypothetical protein
MISNSNIVLNIIGENIIVFKDDHLYYSRNISVISHYKLVKYESIHHFHVLLSKERFTLSITCGSIKIPFMDYYYSTMLKNGQTALDNNDNDCGANMLIAKDQLFKISKLIRECNPNCQFDIVNL